MLRISNCAVGEDFKYSFINNSIFNSIASSITGHTINITHVNRVHMGAYQCVADNGIPPIANATFYVEVHCECSTFAHKNEFSIVFFSIGFLSYIFLTESKNNLHIFLPFCLTCFRVSFNFSWFEFDDNIFFLFSSAFKKKLSLEKFLRWFG